MYSMTVCIYLVNGQSCHRYVSVDRNRKRRIQTCEPKDQTQLSYFSTPNRQSKTLIVSTNKLTLITVSAMYDFFPKSDRCYPKKKDTENSTICHCQGHWEISKLVFDYIQFQENRRSQTVHYKAQKRCYKTDYAGVDIFYIDDITTSKCLVLARHLPLTRIYIFSSNLWFLWIET